MGSTLQHHTDNGCPVLAPHLTPRPASPSRPVDKQGSSECCVLFCWWVLLRGAGCYYYYYYCYYYVLSLLLLLTLWGCVLGFLRCCESQIQGVTACVCVCCYNNRNEVKGLQGWYVAGRMDLIWPDLTVTLTKGGGGRGCLLPIPATNNNTFTTINFPKQD